MILSKIKMVKTKHTCEWSGCNKDYPTYEQAEECENQGFIGPSIKPGLILRLGGLRYEVFTSLETNGHERAYTTTSFSNLGDGELTIRTSRTIDPKTLESEVVEEKFSILSDEEFEALEEPVKKTCFGKSFDKLYREHAYFQK